MADAEQRDAGELEPLGSLGDGKLDAGNDGAGGSIDPNGVAAPRRRGGARPGAGRKAAGTSANGKPTAKPAQKAAKAAVVSVDALALIVGIVGNFVAAKSKQEALSLDNAESRAIAEAAANVAKLYEIPVNEKTAAWVALATTVGTIYGAKIAVIKLNRELKKGTAS